MSESSTSWQSRRAQRWFRRLNESRHLLWLLAVLSFLETIVIPVPIEVVLIPLMAINRDRIWTIAAVVTAGCLAASVVGYGVGMMMYESIGRWFIDTMGYQQAYEAFHSFFDAHGFAAILLVGILPIPFQVAMITAGLSGYPLALFVFAAVIARGMRYFGLAWLVARFGDTAQQMWQRHALKTGLVAAAVVVAVYLAGHWAAAQIV